MCSKIRNTKKNNKKTETSKQFIYNYSVKRVHRRPTEPEWEQVKNRDELQKVFDLVSWSLRVR